MTLPGGRVTVERHDHFHTVLDFSVEFEAQGLSCERMLHDRLVKREPCASKVYLLNLTDAFAIDVDGPAWQ